MASRLIALLLFFLATSAFAEAPSFITTDKRLPIPVNAVERNQVLYEMREFLHGLYNIQIALSKEDMKAVAVTAKPMGGLLDRFPASLRERLPEEFTQIAIAMREAFDALARDAETKGEMRHTLAQIAEVLAYCSGCHDTYRFQLTPARAQR